MNECFTQEELKRAISMEIICGAIALPLRKISLSDARDSFLALQKHHGTEKFGVIQTKYQYQFDPCDSGWYLDEPNLGNEASDYFQQANRYACGSINAPSPVRTWGSEKFLNGLLNALWTLKFKEINAGTFRTCLSLRKYVASQFKPSVAKTVYDLFHSQKVLDFSAGWGDRLCGFYAAENTQSYIGIDPNAAVYDKYFQQASFYENFAHKETEFICKPAEEVILPRGCVDTVFTSPPYFNIERYCDDATQSFKRYKKLDDWLTGFLFKAIDLSVTALSDNGHLLINISDVYSGHQINHICDPMNQYIKEKGLIYCGMMGMRMAKRPNSNAEKTDGIFVEPIWVWKKPSQKRRRSQRREGKTTFLLQ